MPESNMNVGSSAASSNRMPGRHDMTRHLVSTLNDKPSLELETLLSGIKTPKTRELLEHLLIESNNFILRTLVESYSVYEVHDRIESALGQRGVIEALYQLSISEVRPPKAESAEEMTA